MAVLTIEQIDHFHPWEILLNSADKEGKVYLRLTQNGSALSVWLNPENIYQLKRFLETQLDTIKQ
jgi:hypothetical protein